MVATAGWRSVRCRVGRAWPPTASSAPWGAAGCASDRAVRTALRGTSWHSAGRTPAWRYPGGVVAGHRRLRLPRRAVEVHDVARRAVGADEAVGQPHGPVAHRLDRRE